MSSTRNTAIHFTSSPGGPKTKLPTNGLNSPILNKNDLSSQNVSSENGFGNDEHSTEQDALLHNTSSTFSRMLHPTNNKILSNRYVQLAKSATAHYYHRYISDKLSMVPNDKTTSNNIIGWYFYLFSSEPFIVSVVSTYMPILLESYARSNAVLLTDHFIQCPKNGKEKCVLGLFDDRVFIDTSSYALYTFSSSVFFQIITVISISGLVDVFDVTIRFKKTVLILFGIIGSLSTIAISFSQPADFYLLAVLSIVTNCCYGVINVVGNSLLPVIVTSFYRNQPCQNDGNFSPLLYTNEEFTNIVSGRGSSIGYLSALIVQIFCIFMISKVAGNTLDADDNTYAMKLAVLFVGVWWFIWQLPMLWFLKDYSHEDGELPTTKPLTLRALAHYTKKSWTSLYDSFKHASLLKDVVIFLIGWFIISDSITTINSTAMLFSKTELSMTTINLVVVSILTLIFAIFGAFVVPQFITTKLGKKSNQSMIYTIVWASFIPLYGLSGFWFTNFGLKHKIEMYFLAVWYGISLGALNAISRSIFSLIVPPGKESTFFSLFSITDKGSSIVGPTLVGLITDKTHDIRYSFYLLFVLLVVSLPFFYMLDVDRGKKEAVSLSCVIQERLEEEEEEEAAEQ
ncbi:hypothetical protein ACO0QE_002274 [Hanseniaspora vineae]